MTIPIWSIPTALMFAVVAWAYLMPMPSNTGPFAVNFGAMMSALFRLVVVVFVAMGSWLVYFMWRAA